MIPHPLLDSEDSILIVIDVQQSFLDKLQPAQSSPLVNRIAWLAGVAVRLRVPIVATAEDIPVHGGIIQKVADRFPPQLPVFNKMVFNLAEEEEILEAVESAGRKTCVLVGIETDVCVAHSAIGLLQRAYRVAIVEDATGSPGTGHTFGIERARTAGALIVSVKGLYYEWIRTVPKARQFSSRYLDELGRPDGITL